MSFSDSQLHATIPDAQLIVACVPAVEEVIVIRFPLEPVAKNPPAALTVVVELAGKITVLGPVVVIVFHELAPASVTDPVPPPVIDRLLNTGVPSGGASDSVFPVALVSLITRVLVPAFKV